MQKSRYKGIFSLAACIAGIWIVTGFILPSITDSFKITRNLAEYIDESGIETGQFYYTGVESTAKAESGARASIAFWETRQAIKKGEPVIDK